MDVGLAPIIFILMASTTAVQSQIQKGPANALKKVGENVTLECVTSSKNCDEVEWQKMEGAQSPKTVFRDGTIFNGFQERYSVSGTGGCSLTIRELEVNDSGRFTCVLTVDANEKKRGSVLVVISVRESCRSNVTNNELSENDVYRFSTAISVPAKSVEPSNVILYFQNKTVGEIEKTDEKSQPQTVKTTLTGKASRENIRSRVCRASLPPNTADGFDRSTAYLDVCTTQQLIVSHPVENIAVLPPGPYHKDSRVTCTAAGHPPPTFKWTNLKSGDVVDGDTLMIDGEAGDKYNCTATNTVKGKETSLNITIEVSPPESGCGTGCIIGIVFSGVAVVVIGVASFFVYKRVNKRRRHLQTS